ncbi:agmatine deiminase family protein [Shewanella surugensis]|uniref:Agmatine deiminase family protein n=1 Tax=Shewanella surugensis TaxID=212020 RepID=A0ABT0L7H7_9GAMM|nr:agmatine deiminase family protein [Shewanella surugensis]MCL1123647.1 agmatine deiminase family protein [Shewanella surugensis]
MKRGLKGIIGLMGFFMMSPSVAELIILASPPEHDTYYDEMQRGIIDFQINYAKKIIKNGDEVLVLSTKTLFPEYADALGSNRVMIAPMSDIWMRDFTLVNPDDPVMFRYTAAGQGGGKEGQIQADDVQDTFYQVVKKAGLHFKSSELLDDGGNFVSDYAGNGVISSKFLQDNQLTEKQARKKLKALLGVKHIAFIEADEQGGLEHADGVVSFIGPNTLAINAYPEDPQYAAQLKADLMAQLPEVKLVEITTPYDGSQIYDKRFGSACGLYINMLVTKKRIYLPQFGIPQDKLALQQVRAVTSKDVIPVSSSQVCHMGGGVRCMSLQLRGENARKLLDYAKKVSDKKQATSGDLMK